MSACLAGLIDLRIVLGMLLPTVMLIGQTKTAL